MARAHGAIDCSDSLYLAANVIGIFNKLGYKFAPWTQNRYIRRTLGPSLCAGWRPERCGRIALVLQGGGALGAYQAGVYQALHEAGLEPDWVSGVSIGAINAALIAGNAPEQRLEALARILEPHHRPHHLAAYARRRHLSARCATPYRRFTTALFGQPGFFKPHKINPWFLPPGAKDATSYYDNTPAARRRWQELVDFKLLNSKATAVSRSARSM